jgi:hypothetical protein
MKKQSWIFSVSFSKCTVAGTLLCLALGASSFAATGSSSCATNPESRQLDYWLGNWKVGAAGSSSNASSMVSLSLDKCLVVEHWDGGNGHKGQNIFGYSADDSNWYGMFADNDGRVHVFTSGKVSSGTAEFKGTSHGSNGETVLNRVTLSRLTANKVEQTWEKSSDNGATWSVVFRGEYSRINP